MARKERAAEGEVRERAIAVARLDDLRRRLALQARDLVGSEGGLAEQGQEEVDELVEVPSNDLPVKAHRRRPDIERELGAEAIDHGLDRLGRQITRAATEHARGEATDAVLAVRIGDRAAPDRDDDRDERHGRRALDEPDAAAVEIEAGRHSAALR